MRGDEPAVNHHGPVAAALADPARKAIVHALALGDLSVEELCDRLGIEQNAVRRHVSILSASGLVLAVPSPSVAGIVYLKLNRSLVRMPFTTEIPVAQRVIFVSNRGVRRSALAVALWRRRSRMPARAAGINPASHMPTATVATARRHSLALAVQPPISVGDVLSGDDLLVVVCDLAHQSLAGSHPRYLHWSVAEPMITCSRAAFDSVISELLPRIDHLAGALARHRKRPIVGPDPA